MRKFLVVFALFLAGNSFGQSKDFLIHGKVISDDEQEPLDAATVYLQRIQDSSLVTYTISDQKGLFTLKDKTSDDSLNLLVSYVGYKTYKQTIAINKSTINLNDVSLQLGNSLDEVKITASAPVTIKKDTLEFNVSSFKTKKGATVEDLLKELPGVEVDEDGKIKVNGKEVNKILVNGKPFFGNDPTITTKNLTKEIIEKVQVVDTKTKSEAFAGEAGDKENKTINLTIKEENNKGVFGRVAAGAGTDKRYEFAGMFNRFDNDQRISILAGGNNINSPGFSFGEISKMFGRGNSMWMNSDGSFGIDGRRFGGGQGITTSRLAGANYADDLTDNVELSANYFHSQSDSKNKSTSQRETFLSDSRYFSNSRSSSKNETENHEFRTEFEIEVDSTFLITINPSFKFSKSSTDYTSNDETLDEEFNLTNQSSLHSLVKSEARNFSNELSTTKRFGDKGSYLKLNLRTTVDKNNGDDYVNSVTELFGTDPDTEIRDQYTKETGQNYNINTDISYRLAIKAKELFVNFEYEYERNKDKNAKSTFDANDITGQYDTFNTDLSTDFEYTSIKNAPGVRLTYNKDKWFARFGVDYVYRTLKNNDGLRPEFNVERDFEAIEMRSNINYKFNKKTSLYIGYRLSNNPPALRHLQAFEDVSNPLNTIIGNPNLEPTNRHRFHLGFNSYNWQEKTGIYVYSNITAINNNVVSKTTIDPETLKRTTTYQNVNGNYRGNFSVSYSKRFKLDTLKTLRLKIGNWSNFSKNINYNNDVQYANKILRTTPNVGFDFVWNDVFEFRPRYNITLTSNKFDIDAIKGQSFTSHTLNLNSAIFLPKKFEWRNDIAYNYNPNVAGDFQKSAWFWNASVSYSFLKDKGLITLKVYDLLNQNTNAKRVVEQDYIEDSQSTVLQQYVMLNFSWKFNSLGPKGESGNGGMYFLD